MQRRVAGQEVEPARDQVPGLDLAQQRAHARFARQRLEHELDRAAARQPEAPCLVRRHAVGHRLGARLRHAEPARAVDDVVLDAAARDRADDEPVVAHREHRAFGARRAAPGLDHGDQQHAAARRRATRRCASVPRDRHCPSSRPLPIARRGAILRPGAPRRLTPRGAWRLLGASHPRFDPPVPNFFRFVVPAAMIAGFVALATVALDKPGYYYDEVIFVPVALRVLGQCDVDAAVTVQIGCLPLMQTLGYVGAVKAWLHAPLIAPFGINVWTVRLPSILIAAATLFVVWLVRAARAGRRVGAAAARAAGHRPGADQPRAPRLGPAHDRGASCACCRWSRCGDGCRPAACTGSVTLCAALLVGFFDKLNFLWVIVALVGAGGDRSPARLVVERLRDGRPWQPAIAGVTGALLLWGVVTLVRRAAKLDILGDAGDARRSRASWSRSGTCTRSTFSGTSVLNWVFGTDAARSQRVQRACARAARRRRAAARALAAVDAGAAAARVPHGGHRAACSSPSPPRRRSAAPTISSCCGRCRRCISSRCSRSSSSTSTPAAGERGADAVRAWRHVRRDRVRRAARVEHRAWTSATSTRGGTTATTVRCSIPAIAKLGERLDELDVDRVISVDWGLHQPLVTLRRPRARRAATANGRGG